MPLDISLFRTNPEVVRESQRRRFASVELVDEIIAKDNVWRNLTGEIDDLKKRRNQVQKDIATIKKAQATNKDATPEQKQEQDKQCETLVAEKTSLDQQIINTEERQKNLKVEVDNMVNKIGNIVLDSVPFSKDEDADNRVERTWGKIRDPAGLLNHHDLLWRVGGYEPERGAAVAGHRGYFLRDVGVMLNQAFINYGIAFLRKRGYVVLQPPFMMKKDVMAGVAQLEQFDEELYKVTGDTDDKYLIATSEQPICAYHKDEWMEEKALPLFYCGISTCFRKEAGSHGKDTWGIFRVHQFEKIEQFAIVEGDLEKSNAIQEEMIKTAEEFYQSLGFPYRVINIVSGALNNAAIRKFDLEAWFPGYNNFRELVSCSNCTDYQSRAMEIRCGIKKMGDREKKYVHMLNATLCATGRAICCLLENYQDANGVHIPEVLVPFMGGITYLPFVRDSKLAVEKPLAAKNEKKETAPAAPKENKEKKEAVQPPAAPAAAAAPEEKKDAKKDEKKEKKEKKEAAKKKDSEPVYAKYPDTITPPPAYVTPAPHVSSQQGSAVQVEAAPALQGVVFTGEQVTGVDVAALEARLVYFSYVAGDLPGAVDNQVFQYLSNQTIEAVEAPNVARWLRHLKSTPAAVREQWK
jgi:seryl-tRNA synthetase